MIVLLVRRYLEVSKKIVQTEAKRDLNQRSRFHCLYDYDEPV